ncbi:MAG: sigma-70 family RNA polymerase sigma factor [Clostridia bacterium]|nr:sigma-70 family RNA polymerase sigma factor [Clostridia bacterium]
MSETIVEYYERNYQELLKLAVMTLKDFDAAQDVLHDVAVVILKKQDDLSDVRNCGAYLAQCIRRSALNYIRKHSRMIYQDPALMSELCEHSEVEAEYDYVEWVALIEDYLQKYPVEMRKAFIAHYLDDVPVTAIAKMLDIHPKAVYRIFARMRDTLAKQSPSTLRHINVLSLL